MELSPLERKLAEQPIELPKNPFFEVLTSFSRDEAIAMVVNVAGTAAMDYALGTFGMQQYRPAILAATGPIIEKIGFFPAHFKEAYDVWSTTPTAERRPLDTYVKQALKGGSKSLALDIAVHDPIYAGLMYTGMQLHTQTPSWILAGASFVAAVFVASGLVVAGNELRYMDMQRRLHNSGFGKESYYESRFYIKPDVDPEKIVKRLTDEFALNTEQHIHYTDRYYATTLPEISARRPKVRLRHRVVRESQKAVQTAQVIYTRTSELSEKEPSQFRCFAQKKDKFYVDIGPQEKSQIDEMEDTPARAFLKKRVRDDPRTISFDRAVAFNEQGILCAVDIVDASRPYSVLEIKCRTDKKLLQETMRLVMLEFPLLHITHGKEDMNRLSEAQLRL